jgi:antitoxin HigA-1
MNTKLPPVHPGEVLLEDFMKPLKLSAYRVAKDIGVSAIAISQLTRGRRSLSAQTALLLAKYFGTSPEVWIRLQGQYDLEVTRAKIHARLAKIPRLAS